jgi:hypothetical protein
MDRNKCCRDSARRRSSKQVVVEEDGDSGSANYEDYVPDIVDCDDDYRSWI